MCLLNVKQAGKPTRDAREAEAYSIGLFRELVPATLAPGARILPLDQAPVCYALEHSTHKHTHTRDKKRRHGILH